MPLRPRTALLPTLFTLCFLALAGTVLADSGPRWPDADLVALSEVVLTGRVVRVASAWDTTAGGIYTYVTIDVGEVLKGWIPDRRIVIKQLGGHVEGIGLAIFGQAVFEPGEEALLFLEVRPRDNTLYTSALWQGKWSIEPEGAGERVARRQDPERAGRGVTGAPERRDLVEFVNRIRSLTGDTAHRPGGRTLTMVPVEAPDPDSPSRAVDTFTLLLPDQPRWHEADSGVPIKVDIQTGGQPGLTGNGVAEIPAAVALWNGAGSALRLSVGAERAAGCLNAFEGDGRISISFMDPCSEIDNSGGTIAIGGGWFNDTDTRTVNGKVFAKFVQGTIINNDSSLAQTYLTKPRCFQDIQTHELGHTVGLGHSESNQAIMFATIDSSCTSAASNGTIGHAATGALGEDDIAGIRFIYPGGFAPPPAPAKPVVTATVTGTTVRLSWTVGLGGAPTSYILQAGTTTGGTDAFNQNIGNLTSVVATAAPATYFVRVIAVNAAGSTTSDEITVTVEAPPPCTVPAAPVVATPVKMGNNVRLSWTGPPGASSYVLQADLNGVTVFDANIGSTTTVNATAANGTYTVRIIAVNGCGPGPAATLTVTVP